MTLEKSGGLMKVGVGWEKTTFNDDGSVKTRFFTIKVDQPVMANEYLMIFKQNEKKLMEIFKRDLTERDPRLIVMRKRG